MAKDYTFVSCLAQRGSQQIHKVQQTLLALLQNKQRRQILKKDLCSKQKGFAFYNAWMTQTTNQSTVIERKQYRRKLCKSQWSVKTSDPVNFKSRKFARVIRAIKNTSLSHQRKMLGRSQIQICLISGKESSRPALQKKRLQIFRTSQHPEIKIVGNN